MGVGDTLVIHSDGIIDAQNEQGAFFGEERLRRIVTESAGESALALQTAMLQASEDFSGMTGQFDDITLMTLLRANDPTLTV